MLTLGPVIGTGARSTVFGCGPGRVIKVPLASMPDAWIRHEAVYTSVVHDLGLPVPAVHDLVWHDGRQCIVYERIDGPSMWASICAQPSSTGDFGRQLAELHLTLLVASAPVLLPRQHDRCAAKIHRVANSIDAELGDAIALLPTPSDPLRLCHGDLHPGNVIMSPAGPVILDWFDSCRGVPIGDVARSALLMGAGGAVDRFVPHLPGAAPGRLRDLHDSYLGAMVDGLRSFDRREFDRWMAIEAVARVAEGFPPPELVALWRSSVQLGGGLLDERAQGAEHGRR